MSEGNQANGITWDGNTYCYIAPDRLAIDESLQLHTAAADSIDPIDHEVLRHALWNVNNEHGQTMMRVSGSPICAYSHDFNPSILDERGDFVFFGPFLQYLTAATNAAVKWTLEYRSENPGIEPGDIFLNNDPWVGATHQSDVAIYAPVFVEGKLFCWVANTLHQHDLGGTAPGGFNPIAENVYWEAPCIQPAKIVEGGRLRRDLEDWYVRSSRVPKLVKLDLRAQIAGCNVARERIEHLVERHGADQVKACMRKVQDDSEQAFVRRLDTVPDGTWAEEAWVEGSLPGDRSLYRNRLTLTKQGHTLTFSNEGCAPEVPTVSTVYAAWKGAVVSMLSVQMLYDQMFAVEGALRHCEFQVEPGTVTCANRPMAVQGSTGLVLPQVLALGGLVVSKMLASSTDPELRREALSCMSNLSFPVNAIEGTDQRGEGFATFLMDPAGAALPAWSWRDGQDTGGWPWDLQSTMPNVEDHEIFYPILYLWRKEVPDSGGAGRFRGGNGGEFAYVPHMTDRMVNLTVSSEVAIPGPSIFGGYPPATNKFEFVTGARIWDQVAADRQMPRRAEDIRDGERRWVPAKSVDCHPTPDDVWICAWSAAGGYGDPIDRDPEAVRADVAAGRVTAEWAREAYGVALTGEVPDVAVDADATASRRREIVEERLAQATPWRWDEPADPRETTFEGPVGSDIDVAGGELRSDGSVLSAAGGNYKTGSLVRERELHDINPHIRNPEIYTDSKVRLREFISPSTGRILQTEIAIDDAPPLWDVRIGKPGQDAGRA
jgi:N-methylhydantoinase B